MLEPSTTEQDVGRLKHTGCGAQMQDAVERKGRDWEQEEMIDAGS